MRTATKSAIGSARNTPIVGFETSFGKMNIRGMSKIIFRHIVRKNHAHHHRSAEKRLWNLFFI